jgi:hypothetical protein
MPLYHSQCQSQSSAVVQCSSLAAIDWATAVQCLTAPVARTIRLAQGAAQYQIPLSRTPGVWTKSTTYLSIHTPSLAALLSVSV